MSPLCGRVPEFELVAGAGLIIVRLIVTASAAGVLLVVDASDGGEVDGEVDEGAQG